MTLNIFILLALIAAALWTVMTRSLLRSALGLALTSIILTILMFQLDSPLAAVFELSVCAGLISVLFISTISLSLPLSEQEWMKHMRERMARFWFLPLLLILVAVVLSFMNIKPTIHLPAPDKIQDVRFVMWHLRRFDSMGQIIILLAGVFGVVILFKEKIKK
ncbi:MAG: NADH-quinone oxidoreductase subunit J [Candidatus Omnitrophica bacterium]|nr:NADH-quinone oxidoreductase subunit J [Candidatus Omnitrophota bacterium]